MPPTLAAGSRLTLTNTTDDEVHELVAIRIADDERRPAAELVALSTLEGAVIFRRFVAGGLAHSGPGPSTVDRQHCGNAAAVLTRASPTKRR